MRFVGDPRPLDEVMEAPGEAWSPYLPPKAFRASTGDEPSEEHEHPPSTTRDEYCPVCGDLRSTPCKRECGRVVDGKLVCEHDD